MAMFASNVKGGEGVSNLGFPNAQVHKESFAGIHRSRKNFIFFR